MLATPCIMVLMQPQQNTGQYDFFMNPEKPSRRNPLGGGNSLGTRVGIILGGAVLLIIVIAVAASMFSGGGGNTPRLLIVAEDQNELARVAQLGAAQGVSQTTKNFAQSCYLTTMTAQQQLINFIATHGSKKPSTKTLALKQNSATDTALGSATASSSFDTTFTTIMQTQISAYKNDIQTAYTNAGNASEKQMLSSDYNDAQLLLQEITSPDQ
jgi:hypothetical protein